MKQKIYIKLALLNLVIIIINVILFSPAFVGLSFTSGSALKTAFAISEIIFSVLIFAYGNYSLLTSDSLKYDYNLKDIKDDKGYIQILRGFFKIKFYENEIFKSIDQIERFERKETSFKDILYQKFNTDAEKEMFFNVFNEVEDIFYKNIKKIISILSIFDEVEYETFLKHYGGIPEGKLELYQNNIKDINNILKENEEILLSFDKLISEATRFGDSVEESKMDESNLKKLDDITSSLKELRTNII